MTHNDAPRTAACAAFDATLVDYLAGRLTERAAERIEAHAAECVRCECVLELATRVPDADFAPPLPDVVRTSVLAAVYAQPRSAATTAVGTLTPSWRWPIAGGALLAAAATLVLIARAPETREPRGDSARASITTPPEPRYGGNAAMESAARLASDRARSEFESLDAAAREIEGALQASPGDAELRVYLSAVRARRSELAQRVSEATS